MKDNTIPEWAKNLTIYEVNIRQYTEGGTFKEFKEHLPRLKELGAGILWFMPVQPIGKLNRKGTLGSYYSIRDYIDVNPDYGTIEEFKELVVEAHIMGMYVILDWVANHTAWDHVWRDEHPDFYTKDENGNFKAPVPEWEDVMELDYSNPSLRITMIESMKYWLREAGIDGFRCDMAHLVPNDFWEEARTEFNKIKHVFMLAESEDKSLLDNAFSVEYNWNIFHTGNNIVHQKNDIRDLDKIVDEEINSLPENATYMLFTSNHDENSWQGSAIERLGVGLEPINVLMFTLEGIPLIYSGQEAGLSRKLSFFEKDFIEWKTDKMFSFYQKLIALKKSNPALWANPYGGAYIRLPSSTCNSTVYTFIREKDNHKVLVITNLSNTPCQTRVDILIHQGYYKDIFEEENIFIEANHLFDLSPWEYKVFEFEGL